MQSLRGILNFVRTAELGSFAKAGRELNVSAVAVGQNISRLERSLGVRLFARSTRQLLLTPEGNAFLQQCRQPLAELEAACREAASEVKRTSGLVRVTLVSPVAQLFVLPSLPKFFRQYPDISLDLELSEEANPLIARRFDVGIRAGALKDAAYVARPLGPLRLLVCAAPAYLAQHGVPRNPDDLNSHALLQLQITGRQTPVPFVLCPPGGKPVQLAARKTRLACNDYPSLLNACSAGLGIAQLPQPLALPALQSGALKLLLPGCTVEGLQLFVHYPSRKQVPARVRAFVDFVVKGLGNHPDLSADTTGFAAA